MLLLSLEMTAVKPHAVKSVLHEFPNLKKLTELRFECNSISGTGSGNKDSPFLPKPNYLISQ